MMLGLETTRYKTQEQLEREQPQIEWIKATAKYCVSLFGHKMDRFEFYCIHCGLTDTEIAYWSSKCTSIFSE